MDKLIASACRIKLENPLPTGEEYFVAVGVRHFDLLMCGQIIMANLRNVKEWEQGFVDQRGKFYSRKDALELVKETKQSIRHDGKTLFSEDLW